MVEFFRILKERMPLAFYLTWAFANGNFDFTESGAHTSHNQDS
jgi:hypothetical protein